ncbi:ABC transporter permease/substrate-binding protein [Chitinophaga nivalis]|uniref:ABC transporter permease/substrate-binding protein n=1 Tax=Chitinophaga nivalis TaxID=2991709 RepID=A0ABT3IHV6_9BACT|nr:ABC transporter permease/substrate-binding protein [Chitinophaga nivalis]MCW3466785.1 ABC transporter permease/substrate-binding protein [Chitinophaga nivalis]MCW3483524.1 ABC transporter permease/substrate-binding protein [Chitinophaga nivalis]
MEATESFFDFVQQQSGKLLEQTLTHTGLTFISVLLAVAIGVPLGILITRHKKLAGITLGTAGVLQTIPSIALLGFMIPLLGIGPKPAIVALLLYALLPVIRNTYTGISGVDSSVMEAAKGMGMSPWQLLFKVQLPLAMPVILAGIRTATVINVGVATLAAYIAAGGLGEFIFGGIALNNTNMMLAGALPAALLAILFDWLLSRLQHLKSRSSRKLLYALPAILLALSSFYLIPDTYNSKMLAGFTPEFMGRKDGYLGLKSVYGLHIRTLVISDMIMYKAAWEKKLDVISGSSTDGRVQAFDLVVLEDDKHIFPPYYAAPIVNMAVLEQYPELEGTLNLLSGIINDSIMTTLNYRVDYLKQNPEKVAKDFLVAAKLWQPARNGHKGTIRIGAKIFGDGYILANMYKMLIEGHTDLAAVTKTGLGGTKIVFDALTNQQIDLYPEYTGTGLLTILQASSQETASMMADSKKVYDYVREKFEKNYRIKWLKPIGFNNTYALMMRREAAASLHIKSISDLTAYINHK